MYKITKEMGQLVSLETRASSIFYIYKSSSSNSSISSQRLSFGSSTTPNSTSWISSHQLCAFQMMIRQIHAFRNLDLFLFLSQSFMFLSHYYTKCFSVLFIMFGIYLRKLNILVLAPPMRYALTLLRISTLVSLKERKLNPTRKTKERVP